MKFFPAIAFLLLMTPLAAKAADYPAPNDGVWVAHDFKFHTGEVLPEVRLHYLTIGNASGKPVLVLHGTGGSAASMLNAGFAGGLFGPGQPLDAAKYYIIIPDALGHGGSSKPSDGLKAKFPHYDYADMVQAQYRLLTEGMGVRHLRLVIGNSMGGMHTWEWGTRYPTFMDALVPMASQPTAMAARNWMLRRLTVETIRNDPAYKNGDYTSEPWSMKYANAYFGVATSGGTLGYQRQAPTSALADKMLDARLAGTGPADANDYIWQMDSSHDYDPAPDLEKIQAAVLAINSADDERNPPETGVEVEALKRVKNGRLYLIPAGPETSGHGTTGNARFYAQALAEFLQKLP
jgi:homoserine O-acetyltransferase